MGGGKGGSSEPEVISPIQTISDVGGLPEGSIDTYTEDEDKKKEESVAKKRLGARGLRIPLKSTKSTTNTPSQTGLNI